MISVVQALTGAIIDSAILIIIYRYLHIQQKRRYLGIWALSWIFNFLGHIFELLSLYRWFPVLLPLGRAFSLLSGFTLLYGIYDFVEDKSPLRLNYIAVLAVGWFTTVQLIILPYNLETFATHIFLGFIYTWSGMIFIRRSAGSGIAKYITGTVFIMWGIHKAMHPLLMSLPQLTSWGFTVTRVFELMASSCIITVHIRGAKEELEESEHCYKRLFENIYSGVTIYTKTDDEKDFIIRDMNRAGEKIDNIKRENAIGKMLLQVFPQARDFGLYEVFDRVWETGQPEYFPVAHYKDHRISSWRENYVYKLPSGEIVSVFNDVTKRKLAEQKLAYLSTHDYLTGLYNRMYLDEKIKLLERNHKYPIVIISFDIDGLKMINDTFGHEVGDEYIKATANILKKIARRQDLLARISGDEFVLILPNSDVKYGEKTVAQIRRAIAKCKEHEFKIPLNLSIGSAIVTDENTCIEDAMKIADKNMYSEKLHHSRSRRSSIIKTIMKILEARDVITQDHAVRTERIIVNLAKLMGMSRRKIANLKLFAMFHDIGKVGVPDKILFKKGPLNKEEMMIMRRHSEIGHRIALSSPELAHIADLILMHHEWWDGSGYPLGIKGRKIPLECRMLAVVDAYDAMTKDRPYRSAMSHEEAVAELERCSGTQFDPNVVESFLMVLKKESLIA